MRAGDVFMESLVAHGVECIFGNPGSTESSVLDRLADFPQISYYLALHESVAVGAANFYAQATGKTGIVNLHVAPGLGNAIGMMYGALKANTPMIVTSGQQDTRMRLRNPLFTHDLVAMAAPVTKWSAELQSGDEMAPLMQRAFEIAQTPPRGPVFLSLPLNVMEQETSVGSTSGEPLTIPGYVDHEGIESLVDLMLTARKPAIVAGDEIAWDNATSTLVTLAESLGACVFREFLHAQLSFPTQHPNFRGRMPIDAKAIRGLSENFDLVILVGGQFFEDLWFEATEPFPDTTRVVRIESTLENLSSYFRLDLGVAGNLTQTLSGVNNLLIERASEAFRTQAKGRNEELKAGRASIQASVQSRLQEVADSKPMASLRAVHEISQSLPDNAIVIDESLTATLLDVSDAEDPMATRAYHTLLELGFDSRGPGDVFAGRGGGLGQAMSGAVGLQVAHPDRRVVALIGDGSAMYAVQALWSAAHHQLPIIFVVFSNREYRVLKHNLDAFRLRFNLGDNRPYPHMDLANPTLSYVDIAKGMGVSADMVTEPEQISEVMKKALSRNQPHLIDIEISGKQ